MSNINSKEVLQYLNTYKITLFLYRSLVAGNEKAHASSEFSCDACIPLTLYHLKVNSGLYDLGSNQNHFMNNSWMNHL